MASEAMTVEFVQRHRLCRGRATMASCPHRSTCLDSHQMEGVCQAMSKDMGNADALARACSSFASASAVRVLLYVNSSRSSLCWFPELSMRCNQCSAEAGGFVPSAVRHIVAAIKMHADHENLLEHAAAALHSFTQQTCWPDGQRAISDNGGRT